MRSKRNGGREGRRRRDGGRKKKGRKPLPAWDHVGKGWMMKGKQGGDETENK